MTASTKQNKLPYLIGVAGGSGSGKTHFAQSLVAHLGSDRCNLIYQDNFYVDQSSRFDFDGGSVNFDDPAAIDFPLLAACLKQLKAGQTTKIPMYDFATHQRQKSMLEIPRRPLVIVDGILIFHSELTRSLFDDLIFFETPEDLRFQRRLERDTRERGRTAEGVRNQFFKQVKPMHDLYVEPSKVHAKTIIKDLGHYERFLAAYNQKLTKVLIDYP